ncbi:hypothetical protein AMELA_G00235080 [Ameiurus melas]|uniref:Uncharacterized protein n=1 Tax=Ameiurus melas TaxID=219545 RepID=A0A7J6A1Z5_AMEME|nr:hypothetical protein AMELA_G00235080 [Ameiurus melas]
MEVIKGTMFPNDYPELLLFRLMIVFSICIWKKISLARSFNSQNITDTAPAQSPASSSAGFSVVVNAETGSIVNLPALINSTFSDHVGFDITANTQPTQNETEKKHLGKYVT